jgi:hypothetical protein
MLFIVGVLENFSVPFDASDGAGPLLLALGRCFYGAIDEEDDGRIRGAARLGPCRMTVATVNLRVQPYRLLNKVEAAHYCRLPVKKFRAMCPIKPIQMADGIVLWDVQDLDAWIDAMKSGTESDDFLIAAKLR